MELKNKKLKWRNKLLTYILTLICIFLISIGFVYIFKRLYSPKIVLDNFYSKIVIVFIYAFLFYSFGEIYHMFRISIKNVSETIYSGFLSLIMSSVIIFPFIFLFQQSFENIGGIILHFIIQTLIIVIWSILSHKLYFTVNKPKNTLIISDKSRNLSEQILKYNLQKRFNLMKTLTLDEFHSNIEKNIENIETIFLYGIKSSERNDILKMGIEESIDIYVIPKVGDLIIKSSEDIPLFHLPVLKVERYNPSINYLIIKRTFDIIVSGIGLIALSPIMIVISVLIYAYDRHPVLYKQKRLTKNSKEFLVLKFRSMKIDAEKDGPMLSSGDNDDRVTPIGKFIRKFRIDELPQLINIFVGDMSVVGPRPERPEVAKKYEEIIPEFKLRLQTKAGLTGYAQIYGKYNTTPYDKLLMDLIYISRPSIMEDLRLCFATVKILFMKNSTEGVEDGKISI